MKAFREDPLPYFFTANCALAVLFSKVCDRKNDQILFNVDLSYQNTQFSQLANLVYSLSGL